MTLLAPGNRAPPGGEREDLFREWLEAERPGSAKKIISRVRQMHGGKDYDLQFGLRMRGQGPLADLTSQRSNEPADASASRAAPSRYALICSNYPLARLAAN